MIELLGDFVSGVVVGFCGFGGGGGGFGFGVGVGFVGVGFVGVGFVGVVVVVGFFIFSLGVLIPRTCLINYTYWLDKEVYKKVSFINNSSIKP